MEHNGEQGRDNLPRDGKELGLSLLCLCTDKLSNSKSTAVKSSRGLIEEVEVVEDDKGKSEHRDGMGEGKEWMRVIEGDTA